MLKRITNFLKSMSIKATATPIQSPFAPSAQEDTRARETVKRVRQAFKDQAQQIQTMSMKQHGADCIDVMSCRKEKCFIWEPDKIVSKPYTITPAQQMKERKKAEAKRNYYRGD